MRQQEQKPGGVPQAMGGWEEEIGMQLLEMYQREQDWFYKVRFKVKEDEARRRKSKFKVTT